MTAALAFQAAYAQPKPLRIVQAWLHPASAPLYVPDQEACSRLLGELEATAPRGWRPALRVLRAHVETADRKTRRCEGQTQYMMALAGVPERTFYRALERLVTAGVLTREKVHPGDPRVDKCATPANGWRKTKFGAMKYVPSCPRCLWHHGGSVTYLTFGKAAELAELLGRSGVRGQVAERDRPMCESTGNPSPATSFFSGSPYPGSPEYLNHHRPLCDLPLQGPGCHEGSAGSPDGLTGRVSSLHRTPEPTHAPDESREGGRARGVPPHARTAIAAIVRIAAALLGGFDVRRLEGAVTKRFREGATLEELEAAPYGGEGTTARCLGARVFGSVASVRYFAHLGRDERDRVVAARLEREARRAAEALGVADGDAGVAVRHIRPIAAVLAERDRELAELSKALKGAYFVAYAADDEPRMLEIAAEYRGTFGDEITGGPRRS